MPTNRSHAKRAPASAGNRDSEFKTKMAYAKYGLLPGEKMSFELYQHLLGKTSKNFWKRHKTRILAGWIRKHPGTRPFCWWKFDAPRVKERAGGWPRSRVPEPRKRLAGNGIAMWEKFPGILPSMPWGIPKSWHTIDRTNPPMFEPQPAYLQRHGLLRTSEKTKKLNFEPEILDPQIRAIHSDDAGRWPAGNKSATLPK